MGWIVTGIGLAGAVVIAAVLGSRFLGKKIVASGSTRASGLFSTEDEHLTVRSADNVRLLSDRQLRELERSADE